MGSRRLNLNELYLTGKILSLLGVFRLGLRELLE